MLFQILGAVSPEPDTNELLLMFNAQPLINPNSAGLLLRDLAIFSHRTLLSLLSPGFQHWNYLNLVKLYTNPNFANSIVLSVSVSFIRSLSLSSCSWTQHVDLALLLVNPHLINLSISTSPLDINFLYTGSNQLLNLSINWCITGGLTVNMMRQLGALFPSLKSLSLRGMDLTPHLMDELNCSTLSHVYLRQNGLLDEQFWRKSFIFKFPLLTYLDFHLDPEHLMTKRGVMRYISNNMRGIVILLTARETQRISHGSAVRKIPQDVIRMLLPFFFR